MSIDDDIKKLPEPSSANSSRLRAQNLQDMTTQPHRVWPRLCSPDGHLSTTFDMDSDDDDDGDSTSASIGMGIGVLAGTPVPAEILCPRPGSLRSGVCQHDPRVEPMSDDASEDCEGLPLTATHVSDSDTDGVWPKGPTNPPERSSADTAMCAPPAEPTAGTSGLLAADIDGEDAVRVRVPAGQRQTRDEKGMSPVERAVWSLGEVVRIPRDGQDHEYLLNSRSVASGIYAGRRDALAIILRCLPRREADMVAAMARPRTEIRIETRLARRGYSSDAETRIVVGPDQQDADRKDVATSVSVSAAAVAEAVRQIPDLAGRIGVPLTTKAAAAVRRACWRAGVVPCERYYPRNTTALCSANTGAISMRPELVCQVRDYQLAAIAALHGGSGVAASDAPGRGGSGSGVGSGVIILPCGGGKTLVGVMATCGFQRALIMCTCIEAAAQWKQHYAKWTTERVDGATPTVGIYAGGAVADSHPRILITTYVSLQHGGARSAQSDSIRQAIMTQFWDIVVYDEVHGLPAQMHSEIAQTLRRGVAVGLTATPYRADNRIDDLAYLVGPRLYELDWQTLEARGFISPVEYCRVDCPLAGEWRDTHMSTKSAATKTNIEIINPAKIAACFAIVEMHLRRNEKIIVFCDSLVPFRIYAQLFRGAFVEGITAQADRRLVFSKFRDDSDTRVLFTTSVGDIALDFPDASVAIQLSVPNGSARQEFQRLGRTLRINPDSPHKVASFYTLTSGPAELAFAATRSQFLADYGYVQRPVSVAALTAALSPDAAASLATIVGSQADLLASVLSLSLTASPSPV